MQKRVVVALIGALSGFLYVAVGAVGAHAVSDPYAKGLIETAARYQGVHTLALLLVLGFERWGAPRAFWAAPFFIAGLLLFCGGLYGLAFTAQHGFAILTPFGGTSFMIAWLLLGWASLQLKAPPNAP
jgi:uncharacterized membrane protein YgdD (TMEM256/DUF423 family)